MSVGGGFMKRLLFVLLLFAFVCVSAFSYEIVVDRDYDSKGFTITKDSSSYSVDDSIHTVRVMGCRIIKVSSNIWSIDDGNGLVYVALGATDNELDAIDGNNDLLLFLSFNSEVDASFFKDRPFKYVALQSFSPAIQTELRKNGSSLVPLNYGSVVSVDGSSVSFVPANKVVKQEVASEETPKEVSVSSGRVLVVCPHCGESFFINL